MTAVRFPQQQQAQQPVVLERSNPMETARAFVSQRYARNRDLTLMHHFDDWRSWTGSHWPIRDEPSVRAELWQFMDEAVVLRKGQPEPFKPTASKVNDALDALRAVCSLPRANTPPCWIGRAAKSSPPPAEEIIACANGLLHLPNRKLHPATPTFFNASAAPFDFDPDAGCPEWNQFLIDLWGEDTEPTESLQEWFGYFLTTDTRQHKILLLHGPMRSGKGTIGRIATALLGPDNVCSPTLSSLGTNFGPWQLIDKKLAIIADARLSGRQDQHIIAERLLSISGEDLQTIDRKFKVPWTGRLPTRFLILTNELPRIADASAALPSRFIVLSLTNCYLGREDESLTGRLLDEMPGILNWAIEGWLRFSERRRFLQPECGKDLIQELADLSSPISAFVRECYVIDPKGEVDCNGVFTAWCHWCEAQHRDHPGTKQSFGRDLRAAVPGLRVVRHRDSGKMGPRLYAGIRLRTYSDPPDCTA